MKQGTHNYLLASKLLIKTHKVEIIKITESWIGACDFRGFTSDAKVLIPIYENKKRSIEFIGDSWMTGFVNIVNLIKNPVVGFIQKIKITVKLGHI